MNQPTYKQFTFPHGRIEGVWVGKVDSPELVIITNGHNGFYSYGMFPWIQEQLAEEGMASFSYNFSHGGTRGDEDVFTDLEAYARNCVRLQTADLVGVTKALRQQYPDKRIWLLAHSMGSIPTIFGAAELLNAGISIAGMILLAPVSRLDFWPGALIDEWKKTGTITMFNRRTGQDLPHGPELLQEIVEADGKWNIKSALADLDLPLLVIHGEADEAVHPDHGRHLASWSGSGTEGTELILIPNTGHTFGTRHPFSGPDEATWKMIQAVIPFIQP